MTTDKELGFGIDFDGKRKWVVIHDNAGNDLGRIPQAKMDPYFDKVSSPVAPPADASYTPARVAAMVEEIKAKTYDGVKARMLTLLESLLQVKGLGSGSIGRMVDILLQDAERQMLDVATRHVPDISPALLDQQRAEREDTEAASSLDALMRRQKQLEDSLGRVKYDIQQRGVERARSLLTRAAEWNRDPVKLEEAMRVLESNMELYATGAAIHSGSNITVHVNGKADAQEVAGAIRRELNKVPPIKIEPVYPRR